MREGEQPEGGSANSGGRRAQAQSVDAGWSPSSSRAALREVGVGPGCEEGGLREKGRVGGVVGCLGEVWRKGGGWGCLGRGVGRVVWPKLERRVRMERLGVGLGEGMGAWLRVEGG